MPYETDTMKVLSCTRPRPVTHGQVRFTTTEEHVSDRSSVPVHLSQSPGCTFFTKRHMRHLRHEASRASMASQVWHGALELLFP